MKSRRSFLLVIALVSVLGPACGSDGDGRSGRGAIGGAGGVGGGGSGGAGGDSGGGEGGADEGEGGSDVRWIDLEDRTIEVPVNGMHQVAVSIDRDVVGDQEIEVTIEGELPAGVELAASSSRETLSALRFPEGTDRASFYVGGFGVDSLGAPSTLTLRGSGGEFSDEASFEIVVAPIVTSTSNAGEGSLRDVIETAGALSTNPVIRFSWQKFTSPTLVRLESPIVVTKDLEIHGVTVDGIPFVSIESVDSRALLIEAGAGVKLKGLRFANGKETSGDGGCVHAQGDLVVDGVIFESCSAQNGGAIFAAAGLVVENSAFASNKASANGGAISASGAIALAGSDFLANEADYGGAIYGHEVGIVESTLRANEARTDGGAIWAEYLILETSTVDANDAAEKGGAMLVEYEGTIRQSTVVMNKARYGGAMKLGNGASLAVMFSTVFGNDASVEGGGIQADPLLIFSMKGSIIAGNVGGSGPDLRMEDATLDSDGYNIVGDNISSFLALRDFHPTDQVGSSEPIDVLLNGLSGNGGKTMTMRPKDGSPALNAIPKEDCTMLGAPLLSDQVGGRRPVGSGCEIGAFEEQRTVEPI